MKKRLAFWWIAANMLAWTVGIVFVLPGFWAWIVCGALVGTAQWLVLRRRLRLSPAWIAATCLAWTVGIWAGHMHSDDFFKLPNFYWIFLTGGALAGLAQSCLLWNRGSRPGLWTPSMAAGSILGFVLCRWVLLLFGEINSPAVLTAGAIIGAVSGAVSTAQLLAMLRHPKPRQEAA